MHNMRACIYIYHIYNLVYTYTIHVILRIYNYIIIIKYDYLKKWCYILVTERDRSKGEKRNSHLKDYGFEEYATIQ